MVLAWASVNEGPSTSSRFTSVHVVLMLVYTHIHCHEVLDFLHLTEVLRKFFMVLLIIISCFVILAIIGSLLNEAEDADKAPRSPYDVESQLDSPTYFRQNLS